MKFTQTPLAGAFVIEVERHTDDRGFFARTFCRQEFEARGLDPGIAQCNISYNEHARTLRGLHYQAAPHEEAKLVRCVHGQIYDVIVDVRPSSPTRLRWFAVTLDAAVRNALYIPVGFAHGFLTLTPGAEVLYQMSVNFAPESSYALRWNDPALAITWPAEPAVISDKDRTHALLDQGHG
jgi:dTDP-4-dehydrorhamnose 3,5-epimerase